jgi:Fic family protein
MTNAPGKWIQYPEGFKAFLPAPLPPKISWHLSLVRELSEADLALGRLAGEGGSLPNPHLLIRPFIRKEAVLSSKIEGTQATLGELLASEAGAVVDRSPEDLREVANYVVALEHGIKRLPQLPLSNRLIRELHGILLKDVRGNTATPGEFRKSQNWIGPPGSTLANAKFVPPHPSELSNVMGEFERFLHKKDLPVLVQAGLAHYQFEAIHPFLDGNGRVGRLLNTLYLIERKVLPSPILYLSAYFENTRDEYYRRLRAVSTNGEWDEWITYFLRGVRIQVKETLSVAQKINHLLTMWRRKAAGSSTATPLQVIDLLAQNPFTTTNRVAKQLKIAFTTAQRAIIRLEKLRILHAVSEAKRDRVFCAQELLRILE